MPQLHVVDVRDYAPATKEVPAVQAEVEFERSAWRFELLIPVLLVAGAWVQGKKFLYRITGGSQCVPKTNLWLFDGVSVSGRAVKDGAARWPALDVVYNFTEGRGKNGFYRFMDNLWLRHMRNAQAVRNRLKIVKREFANAIIEVAKTRTDGEPIRVTSIAAGSGQGVIEVVRDMRRVGIRCELSLVDIDASALAHARELAGQHGVSDLVTTYNSSAASFYKNVGGPKPDIIEMCGLMDYLRDSLAVGLISKIHQNLRPNGFFLTCHVHPNGESYFLREGINWDMLYRTLDQFKDLINQGGFLETKLYTEPLGIHSVAAAQKL